MMCFPSLHQILRVLLSVKKCWVQSCWKVTTTRFFCLVLIFEKALVQRVFVSNLDPRPLSQMIESFDKDGLCR